MHINQDDVDAMRLVVERVKQVAQSRGHGAAVNWGTSEECLIALARVEGICDAFDVMERGQGKPFLPAGEWPV